MTQVSQLRILGLKLPCDFSKPLQPGLTGSPRCVRKAGNGRGILRAEGVQGEVIGALGHHRMSEGLSLHPRGSAKLFRLSELTHTLQF